jgi:hypothetical protein
VRAIWRTRPFPRAAGMVSTLYASRRAFAVPVGVALGVCVPPSIALQPPRIREALKRRFNLVSADQTDIRLLRALVAPQPGSVQFGTPADKGGG